MKNIRTLLIILVILSAIHYLVADKVADFKLEDIKGKQVKLSDIQGDGLVILDFWATWCVPCKNGLPKMNEIHNKYENVNVITINTDKPRKKTEAKAFLKSNKFSFYSLFDPQSIVKKQMNVINIPRSFIIDPDGEIIYDHTGFQRGDEKHYVEVIEKWLAGQGAPEKMDEKKGVITEESDQIKVEETETIQD